MEVSRETVEQLFKFSSDRKWEVFHTPENLAKAISIESAELLELFQWDAEYEKADLEDELADVLSYSLLLARRAEIDPNEAIAKKIALNEVRYPRSKSTGSSLKHDRL